MVCGLLPLREAGSVLSGAVLVACTQAAEPPGHAHAGRPGAPSAAFAGAAQPGMSLDGSLHEPDSADAGAQLPGTTDDHDAAPDGYAHASEAGAAPTDFVWELPTGFPLPIVPADNPMSVAKVELDRRLFYDTQLSGNQTQSCGSSRH
jgi:hypothetical protein